MSLFCFFRRYSNQVQNRSQEIDRRLEVRQIEVQNREAKGWREGFDVHSMHDLRV